MNKDKCAKCSKHIGGQAVIEGMMMRGDNKMATAVRLPNGKIMVKKENVEKRKGFWKLPFARGFIALWDMLFVGIRTLLWSADQQLEKHEKITTKDIVFTVGFALTVGIVVFFGIPYFSTGLIGLQETESPILFNIVDGIIKILMFVLYIYAISFLKDVKRLFEYHGAEHKAVHCFEAGKELNYENIKQYSTVHPRCGTSFLLFVFAISIVVFSIIPSAVNFIWSGFDSIAFALQKTALFLIRILCLPIIAGISYELLKFTGKFENNFFVRIISAPGLWLQKITTKEPDRKQIEVAVRALKEAL